MTRERALNLAAVLADQHETRAQTFAAWKKRGERFSILPAIARHVDRLEVMVSSGAINHPGYRRMVADTLGDLVILAMKYHAWCMTGVYEADLSDDPLSIRVTLGSLGASVTLEPSDPKVAVKRLLELLDECFRSADPGFTEAFAPCSHRAVLARRMATTTFRLLATQYDTNPTKKEQN